MKYNHVLQIIKSTNRQLLEIGYSWSMIDDFWNTCLTEGKEVYQSKKQVNEVYRNE